MGIAYSFRMTTLFNAVAALLTIGVVYYGVEQIKEAIMATKDELIAQLNGINESLSKVSGETSALVAKVAELEEALNNADNIPDDVMSLVSDIRSRVTAIDDQVTDTAPPAPEPEPENPVV